MLFLHPMWSHENQRIGKQKCTPVGYALHVLADLIGLGGLLLLLVSPVVLAWKGVAGTFHASLFWWLAAPFGVGIVGQVLYQYSWTLATRRGFHFDYERCEASWTDGTQRHTHP